MIVTVKPYWTVRRVDDRTPIPCDTADTDAFTIKNPFTTRKVNFYLELHPDAPQALLDKYPHLIAQPPGA